MERFDVGVQIGVVRHHERRPDEAVRAAAFGDRDARRATGAARDQALRIRLDDVHPEVTPEALGGCELPLLPAQEREFDGAPQGPRPLQALDHRQRVGAERRERMRSRLLASALELVARHGPAATSIDDVISAAQVSRGTFYKYFESPDSLVRELATEVVNELIRMAEPVVLGYTDPAERVATGLRVVTRLALTHPVVAGFIVRLGWPDVQGHQLLLDFVRRDIAEGLRQRRFAPMPIALALNIVSSTVLGAIHSMLQPGCERDFAEQAAASALRALGVPAKEAQRIASLKLVPARPLEGGLMAYTISEPLAAPITKASVKLHRTGKQRPTVQE